MAYKYKIGDTVRCITPPIEKQGGGFHKHGLEFIVREINRYGGENDCQVLFPDTDISSFGVYSHSVELVEKKCKFTESDVGRKVRIGDRPKDFDEHPTWTSEMDAHAGSIGTIASIRKYGSIRVTFSSGDTFWYKPEWIDLYEEPKSGYTHGSMWMQPHPKSASEWRSSYERISGAWKPSYVFPDQASPGPQFGEYIDIFKNQLNAYKGTQKSLMHNLKTKIKLALMGEPEKTLVTAGIITENKDLTDGGRDAFIDFLYTKFGDEFIVYLAPLVAEEKKD